MNEKGKGILMALPAWAIIIAIGYGGLSACSQNSNQQTLNQTAKKNAVLLKICSDGTRIVRLPDGMVRTDDYQHQEVADWRTVCTPGNPSKTQEVDTDIDYDPNP